MAGESVRLSSRGGPGIYPGGTGIHAELGGRFYDEIERLIGEVCRQPVCFCLFDPPVRRHFSDVFPYALLYVDQPDRVLIVAVMHMKRRPGYWKQRLT